MAFLLDTNVVSEPHRRTPDTHVLRWFDTTDTQDLFVSVLLVGEVRQGVERLRRRDPSQAAVKEPLLDRLVHDFAGRILPITVEICNVWGRLNVPHKKPVVDGLLAATALVHDLTLTTRNTPDFAGTGARLFNPFEYER